MLYQTKTLTKKGVNKMEKYLIIWNDNGKIKTKKSNNLKEATEIFKQEEKKTKGKIELLDTSFDEVCSAVIILKREELND